MVQNKYDRTNIPGLFRDKENPGALVNDNLTALLQYKKEKEKAHEFNHIKKLSADNEKKLNNIEASLHEIKNTLSKITVNMKNLIAESDIDDA